MFRHMIVLPELLRTELRQSRLLLVRYILLSRHITLHSLSICWTLRVQFHNIERPQIRCNRSVMLLDLRMSSRTASYARCRREDQAAEKQSYH